MFANNVKLSFRILSRQKVYSLINITGLAIGLASALIIMLWVNDESSYDTFHSKSSRTYRLIAAASNLEVAITPAPVAPALEELVPEISHTVRLMKIRSTTLQAGEVKFEEPQGFHTDPSFFDVFDFTLSKGNPATALAQPNNVVLTEALAIKYFGSTDVLGKSLLKDGIDEMTVTGILAPVRGNSHLQFDLLMPWSYAATRDYNIKNNVWGNFDFYTYITFDSPKSTEFIDSFEKRMNELYKQHETSVEVTFTMQPLSEIHLHSHLMADVKGHGNAQYVQVFTIIAVFVVLIGCINFMNLSTARAARRAREVGLRKVAGAARWQLIRQFIGESLVITFIALLIALVVVALCLPEVNRLVGKQLAIDLFDPFTVGMIALVAVVTGLVSGVYPAFILSAFRPASVLKNDASSLSGRSTFRNALVVAQFVISIILLTGTTIVFRQLEYMRGKDLGFEKENLLFMTLNGDVHDKITRWRSALEANELTSQVTISNGVPANYVSGSADVKWQGKDPAAQIMFAMLAIDEQFIPVYNLDLLTGRNFYAEMRGDSSNYIINQTGARIMGYTEETAIGQAVERWGTKGTIVGVVRDFNFKPLQEAIEPLIMAVNNWGGTITVKASAGKTTETIDAMKATWNSLENVYPFSYSFVDDELENLYASDRQVGTLFTVFAVLAIAISCLGLYGLSAFVAVQRTREIGIRKALGASVPHIIFLLNRRFVLPIIVAMFIAAPLSWLVMSQWLKGFAYRIGFSWDAVIVAGISALLISIITVSYESVNAARANPVKALRAE